MKTRGSAVAERDVEGVKNGYLKEQGRKNMVKHCSKGSMRHRKNPRRASVKTSEAQAIILVEVND